MRSRRTWRAAVSTVVPVVPQEPGQLGQYANRTQAATCRRSVCPKRRIYLPPRRYSVAVAAATPALTAAPTRAAKSDAEHFHRKSRRVKHGSISNPPPFVVASMLRVLFDVCCIACAPLRKDNLMPDRSLICHARFLPVYVFSVATVCASFQLPLERSSRQESRLTNSVGMVTCRGAISALSILPSNNSTICFPNCSGNSRTVVRAGLRSGPSVSLEPGHAYVVRDAQAKIHHGFVNTARSLVRRA